MNKARVLLVLAFVVVCAAGAVVGTAVDRRVRPVAVEDPLHIGLTADQAPKVKSYWDEVGKLRHQIYGTRHELEHQRHDEFEKILTPEQLAVYKKLQQEYDAKFKALDDQLRQAAHDADQRTRALLTPPQLANYDAIRARMGPPGMGPPPGFGPPGMGPGHPHHDRDRDREHFRPNPTTAPATAPASGAV
jgi:hypothetical protein